MRCASAPPTSRVLAQRLTEVAGRTTSPLISTLAADATARSTRAVDGLRASPDTLLALGADLLAAETFFLLGARDPAGRRPRQATALRNEVTAFKALEGADTPGLLQAPGRGGPHPPGAPGRRPRRSGVASKDIASELFLWCAPSRTPCRTPTRSSASPAVPSCVRPSGTGVMS